ncbi:MAG: hypothetical protein LBV59_25145, partial [Sphingobacterium sp.]|uniref:hypothetical protein n=1 Tax=Sphingobacterium sp. TaxID=341027 RepID=UPI00283C70CE
TSKPFVLIIFIFPLTACKGARFFLVFGSGRCSSWQITADPAPQMETGKLQAPGKELPRGFPRFARGLQHRL